MLNLAFKTRKRGVKEIEARQRTIAGLTTWLCLLCLYISIYWLIYIRRLYVLHHYIYLLLLYTNTYKRKHSEILLPKSKFTMLGSFPTPNVRYSGIHKNCINYILVNSHWINNFDHLSTLSRSISNSYSIFVYRTDAFIWNYILFWQKKYRNHWYILHMR